MLASGPGPGGGLLTNVVPGIAIDATTIYWADAVANKIMRVPRSGGIPVTITGASTPAGLVIDDAYIYWANFGDGTIMRNRQVRRR